jgi:hypothetical protein
MKRTWQKKDALKKKKIDWHVRTAAVAEIS